MASEEQITCPLCGNRVPESTEVCPNCQTPLAKLRTQRVIDKVIESRLMQQLQARQTAESMTPTNIPDVRLPRFKESCPSCGVELKGGEPNCPRCGVPLAVGSSLVRCEKCGSSVAAGAASCPKCGTPFIREVDEVLIAPPKPIKPIRHRTAKMPPPPPPPPPPAHEVTTQPVVESAHLVGRGLTNGRGAINGTGLVNGTGMVNGTGLVNGTGMVNGTGITNGTRGEARPRASARYQKNLLTRWQFMAILVALVIIIPTFIYISYYEDKGRYEIDGSFGEWSDADTFGMMLLSDSESLNVDDWAIGFEQESLFFYVDAQGSIMDSTEVQSVFLFVDVDGSEETGYMVGGLGAEYVLELDGWNGSVESSGIYSYESDDDLYDWNSFDRIGSLAAHLEADELEAMATIPSAITSASEFMLFTQDQLERRAVSHTVPAAGGVLVVRQELVSSVALSGIVTSSTEAPLLRLTFWAQGAGGTVSSIDPDLVGVTWTSDVAEFEIAAGDEVSVEISVDTSSAADGAFVSASVSPSGITSSFANVRVIGEPARAYARAAPSVIAIDGAFGDWSGKTMVDVDDLEVLNPNIDIDEAGNVNTTAESYFFVSVNGDACCGTVVPVIRGKPVSGSGGGIVVPMRKTAEDIARIFVDIDKSATTGAALTAGDKTIGADRLIELRGLDGRIVSTSTYQYSSGAWAETQFAVDAANDFSRLEVGVSTAGFGGSYDIDFIIQMTDWRGRQDMSELDPALTARLATWSVDTTTASSTATELSNQRKIFYDGTNFWSFYVSGTDTVCRYSIDGGATWNVPTDPTPFVTGGIQKASLWYDSANSAVYIVGDRSVSSTSVYIQKGAVNPSTHAISWQGSDVVFAGSANPRALKSTYISMDANGYLWLMSLNKTGTGAAYNLAVYKSTNVRSISAWTFSANMLGASANQPSMKGSVVPAGTGSDVWAVYTYQGDVAARKYSSGSWSASEAVIYDNTGTDLSNSDLAPPSVSVSSSGRVHVVYGNGNLDGTTMKPHIWFAYNTTSSGASWTQTRISSSDTTHGYKYPTVSIESTSRSAYAFFVNLSGYNIIAKKKLASDTTWTVVNLGSQSANDKNFLTSIYSVSGETNICFQWTETAGSSDYDVYFDRIPEFSDVVIPVFVMLVVFIASSRARRRKEAAQ